MFFRRFFIFILALLTCGTALAADGPDLQIRTVKPGATVNIDRVIEDGKVVISVMDEGENPIFGLGSADFGVTQSGRTADIVSVQPLSESMDVPRHIVLVLDNSSSMKKRRAVSALLRGVDELLKIVRPIDQVDMVVFDNFKRISIGPYYLSVGMLHSSDPEELKAFAKSAYSDKMTGKTVLYDAMLAGIELMKGMPESEPRFMVVFSDGADLNSSHDDLYVLNMAIKVKGFNAYAIDYMPGPYTNTFLTEFTAAKHGQIWKAKSENDLVGIFQEVASKMLYYYVVEYRFPPTGSLSAAPAVLKFDEIAVSGAAPVTKADTTELTLGPVVDSVYGIADWKVSVSNAAGTVAELSGQGAPASGLKVPLPTTDLGALAHGGALSVKMVLRDNKGQELALDAPPVKVEVMKTTAGMSVTPAVLKFDEVRVSGAEPVIRVDAPAITARPVVDTPHGIANWKVMVGNAGGGVAELAGQGGPAQELNVPLPTKDLGALLAGGDLAVKMELKDNKGNALMLDAVPVRVEVSMTSAGLAVVPDTVTIEEVRTIDASPMLSHIYFDKGSSVIPAQYVRFAGPEQMAGFDEQKFRDAMEKYYQVLNIVGKRLTENPEAAVTIVGCNDNTGEEKGNKKLSGSRAEAVRDYLKSVWNIDQERMTVEVRNLPEMPSAKRLPEGQAENRRVEIRSDERAILAPIQSTYFTNRIDTPALTLRPDVDSPNGIAIWKVAVSNRFGNLAEMAGEGPPADEILIPLADSDLKLLATGGDITVRMELKDNKGQSIAPAPETVKVDFIQTSKRLAKKEGQRVQEKYALILFDFDKANIDAQNQDIVDNIVARIKALPDATVEIVGHSDNIGREEYNVKLSERRAVAVYDLLKASYDEDPGDRVSYTGVGPNEPLYDNRLPEGRSFNRTVTITLEYMSAE